MSLLTKIPIVIYDDNIREKSSANPGQEQWRVFLKVAKKWRDAANRRGGNVTFVHLPKRGTRSIARGSIDKAIGPALIAVFNCV
jgi:hypothetical protein